MRIKILYFVVLVCFLLALGRLANNFGNFIEEDARFYSLSNTEKYIMLFPCYKVAEYLAEEAAANVLYVGSDGACFFELRYFLYPSRVRISPEIIDNMEYDYILSEKTLGTKRTLVNKISTGNGVKLIYK